MATLNSTPFHQPFLRLVWPSHWLLLHTTLAMLFSCRSRNTAISQIAVLDEFLCLDVSRLLYRNVWIS